MDFLLYYILFKNYELADCEIQFQDLSTLEDPPGDTVTIYLTGSESPAIIDTPKLDEDKTKSIRGKRFKASFLSGDDYDIDGVPSTVDVETFSDGVEGRFLTRITTDTLALPFLGNIVLDDNVEAFQPKANVVTLSAGCGLGTLKDVELTESDGDIPVGHYRIIDYITLCLRNLTPSQDIHVVFNKFELDTDPDVTHAFFDTFLDARTFETDVDGRDDCYTVLEKILDAFGCFITYDQDGWWIISWDEYDKINGGVTTLRTGHFNSEGAFSGYTDVSVDKIVAHDGDPLYQGYRLSMDNAKRKYQRKAGDIKHIYRFDIPKDIPCNGKFTRGAFVSGTSTDRLYELDSWTVGKDFPTGGTPTADAFINREVDAFGFETVRYALLQPEASTSEMYIESCPIQLGRRDEFTISWDWAFSADVSDTGPYTRRLAIIRLEAYDGTYWTLEEDGKWYQSNVTWTVNLKIIQQTITTSDDQTEFINFSLEADPLPAEGDLYIMFLSESQARYNVDVYINSLEFEYKPFVGSGYDFFGAQRPQRPFREAVLTDNVSGQQHQVTGSDESRKVIEKEMFISDSPRPLFKGALKKFVGPNYVLTETWNYYNDTGVLSDTPLAKHILFQWWNQFRKTRTVIETDLQGLQSTQEFGIPSLINRWTILHGGQEDKYFMLTSIPMMDFRTCGWRGVFVEMSDAEGDRNYDDEYNFKFIQ